jgi:hypothetical protein
VRLAPLAASVAFIFVADLPARGEERIACNERPLSREYWSWREIDGRRCWFIGHRSVPKTMLYWRRNNGISVRVADRVPDRPVPVRIDTRTQLIDDFPRRWQTLMQTFTPRSLLDPTPLQEWRP